MVNLRAATLIFIAGQMLHLSLFPQNNRPDGVKSAEKRVESILRDSGIYFKQGLLYLVERRDSEARKEFDKSVEIFLLSGINVKRNQKLRECYNQLIETIYRIEFPKNQSAYVRGVSAVCGWKIRGELADKVSKRVKANSSTNGSGGSSAKGKGKLSVTGFTEQKFEPSSLDELSKLEFTVTEANVDSLEGKYKYIIVATPNRTAGRKPIQRKNGSIAVVIRYLRRVLHDPYSAKYLKWSELRKVQIDNSNVWLVSLRFRAKNAFNAYRLKTMYFYIRNGRIFDATGSDISSPAPSQKGETWGSLSRRTGVSVIALRRANPGIRVPRGRINVPIGDDVFRKTYSRPTRRSKTLPKGVKVVRAKAGDTVEKLAKRYKVSPVEVAKFNGLFTSSRLNAGREIKIPAK